MKFEKNEEAVSPVIGVILMVAITVILAAVIAAFVFNIGGTQTKAPMATFKGAGADVTLDTITLAHQGGDNINLLTTKIIVEQGANRLVFDTAGAAGETFVIGDTMVINVGAPDISVNGVSMTDVPAAGPTLSDLTAGSEITVTMIDIPSSQQIGIIKSRA